MNIYKFELSMLRKSILIWALAIPLGTIFYMSFYPMIAQDTTAFAAVIENYPAEFLAAFGMNPELPMFSLLGYLSLTFGMVQIPLAIQASNYGFHILSVEERELTADFLLSRPITRAKIFIIKCLAAFTSLTIVNIAMWIGTIGVILAVKGDSDPEFGKVIVLLSSIVFLQLAFFGIGLLISVSIKKVSSVLSFSMALGFGMYILSSLGAILTSDIFNIISPYAHFSPTHILINGSYDWSLAIISILIILVTIPLSYFLYHKRNIASL